METSAMQPCPPHLQHLRLCKRRRSLHAVRRHRGGRQRRGARPLALALCCASVLFFLAPATVAAQDWPTFRGPGASGVVDDARVPVRWNVESGENIRFRAAIPGEGHSSPVIWGQRVFLTSAVSTNPPELKLGDSGSGMAEDQQPHTWIALALDKASGKVLWQREAMRGVPRAARHIKASQVNATPATDGKVLVTLMGSEGLVVFDLDGKELWRKDLGVLDPGYFGEPSISWGSASSPAVHDGRVFVQVDRHKDSFLVTYEVSSGKELWRVNRDERPAWSSPIVVPRGQGHELVVLGSVHARGYDPVSGRELWRFKDETQVRTPTPFVAERSLIVAGGYRGRPIHALPLGGSGDLSGKALWSSERGGPYTTTPVAWDGTIFSVADEGILVAWSLDTGERLNRKRTGEHHSASPVVAGGRLYLAGEGGEVVVYQANKELEELARNDHGEALMATPAISDGVLYLRTQSSLVAVGQVDKGATEQEAKRSAGGS